MTDEQIKKYIDTAVERTIFAFRRDGLLKDVDGIAYGAISLMLNNYYGSMENPLQVYEGKSEKMTAALDSIIDDLYFSIIPMYFEDKMTIEQIAEAFGVDVSTIVRNKKRLCLKIYAEMQ